MIINIDNVVSYLLEKDLIGTQSIIDGDLKLVDASRKNRNVKVLRAHGRSYILKQPNVADQYSARTIRREARLYSLVQNEGTFLALRSIIPKYFGFDAKENILIVEHIDNAQSLNEYNYGLPAGEFPSEPAHQMGIMIARYHDAFKEYVNHDKVSFLPRMFPSNFVVVRPGPDIFSRISPANLQLIKVIQKYPDLLEFLEHLYDDWSMETIMHGDMKWDNIILTDHKYDDMNFQMKIVDWELAQIGDPAWDIGGVFHDFITFWLYSLPMSGKENPEQLVASTEYPLQNMKNAIRSFWRGYTKTIGFKGQTSNDLLIRSARYCAARLIQKAYESHQSSAELSNTAFYMVQTSLNIMKNTDDAIIHLFGIPLNYHLI